MSVNIFDQDQELGSEETASPNLDAPRSVATGVVCICGCTSDIHDECDCLVCGE